MVNMNGKLPDASKIKLIATGILRIKYLKINIFFFINLYN